MLTRVAERHGEKTAIICGAVTWSYADFHREVERLLKQLADTDEGSERKRLAELVAIELPGEAQLEMARLSGNRALQQAMNGDDSPALRVARVLDHG